MVNNIEYIAEIGINHNGNISLAYEHINRAKEAGATVAKFQTYKTETRVPKNSSIFDILKQCELHEDEFLQIIDYCKGAEIKFGSTPFCKQSAKFLISNNTPLIKVASFHIANLDLLSYIFKENNNDTIVSTGVSKAKEIEKANLMYNDLGNMTSNLSFLHCISQYPVNDLKNMNLANIQHLKERTNKPVGLSDHSIGADAPMFAIFCGATIIEKHFTVDNELPGADHSMSANIKVFKHMVKMCNQAKEILGEIRGDECYAHEKDIIPFRVESH